MTSARSPASSVLALDPVLVLILDSGARKPAPGLPRRLSGLFRDLARPEPARPAEEIEDLIWALWVSHESREAEETMGAAIEAMTSGHLDLAHPLLDRLVEAHPDWAEAWNKRATLAYIENRDADSLADIGRTLEIEPRHFGAIAGFGQICLRNGHLNEARAAFQVALTVNPHLEGVRELLDELDPQLLMLH